MFLGLQTMENIAVQLNTGLLNAKNVSDYLAMVVLAVLRKTSM